MDVKRCVLAAAVASLLLAVCAGAALGGGTNVWVIHEETTYPYRHVTGAIQEIGGHVSDFLGDAAEAATGTQFETPLKMAQLAAMAGTAMASSVAQNTYRTSVKFISVPRGIVASGTRQSQQYQRDLHATYTQHDRYRKYRNYYHLRD